jgi:hypothetical protein
MSPLSLLQSIFQKPDPFIPWLLENRSQNHCHLLIRNKTPLFKIYKNKKTPTVDDKAINNLAFIAEFQHPP